MINEHSVQAVAEGAFNGVFLKPQYGTYCFSQIPTTILRLLGCSEGGLPRDCAKPGIYKQVILILIDGFGWKFLEKYRERYPFLQRFYERGIVSKLTSQFPSTTAAHITTLCSNQTVGEHGIYEWFMYEPQVNRVVAPLLYQFAGDKESLESRLEPSQFLPTGNFFQEMCGEKIKCRIFQNDAIAGSVYSKWMFEGAERVGYKNWHEGLKLLNFEPGFSYIYFSEFDVEAHRHGHHSPEAEKAVAHCFDELEAWFQREQVPDSTAILVTADHGMAEISPKTTIYLNQKFPDLEGKLKRGSDGHVLAPIGSSRDYFLHVEPQHLMHVYKELKDALKDEAWVCLTAELITRGFFGPKLSDRCRKRLGDLAIIAKNNNSFWWYEEGRFEQKLHAMHGGLTPDEMETIFLFLGT